MGAGTFLPVKADDTAGHAMHAEWGRIDAATADRLNAVRQRGGRLIAVGTTSLRLLESAAGEDGTIRPFEGDTAIFITPGYRFKAIDGLMTNFHLPRSTLFMLVSALMGLERMQAAYAHAIARRLPLLQLRGSSPAAAQGSSVVEASPPSAVLSDSAQAGWGAGPRVGRAAAEVMTSAELQSVIPPSSRGVTGPILDIRNLSKTYKGGTTALAGVDLQIRKGEIFALLGPNGAGKTTLIGAVCGLLRPSGGTIEAFGLDVQRHWREVRRRIGLVPQELAFDMFARVDHSVNFSRGMFGCPPNAARIEEVLRSLSLWDKRESKIRELSGGMKRRVMIAKALSHDPELLFLDEPTAGVDVELRRDMWKQIGELRDKGTTVILTTHYIEEAQEMADRVGVINKGRLLLVDDKQAIMAKLGRTEARISLTSPISALPASLDGLSGLARGRRPHGGLSRRRRHREGQARGGRGDQGGGRRGNRLRRHRDPGIEPRGHLRRPRRRARGARRHEPSRRLGDPSQRAGAVLPHRVRLDPIARADHLALPRRVRRGDRQPDGPRPVRRRIVRRVHRARA